MAVMEFWLQQERNDRKSADRVLAMQKFAYIGIKDVEFVAIERRLLRDGDVVQQGGGGKQRCLTLAIAGERKCLNAESPKRKSGQSERQPNRSK